MAEKRTGIDVLIGGKVYTLTGADPAYLQKVSGYLNSKILECKSAAGYRSLDSDYKELLMNLNIADDYFKASDENAVLKKRVEELEKELYSVRHDAVSTKMKLEASVKQIESLEAKVQEWKEKYNQVKRGY